MQNYLKLKVLQPSFRWLSKLALLLTFIAPEAYAYLDVDPWRVDFGTVQIDDFRNEEFITLSNFGADPLNIYTSSSCNDGVISEDSFSCFYLTPYEACLIRVEFSPKEPGNYGCTIFIDSYGGGSRSVSISGSALE